MITQNRRKHQTDPRYRNGVYTNTAGQRLTAAIERRRQQADCHPLNWGWQFSHRDEADRAVYTQFGLELRYIADEAGWFVAPIGSGDGEIFRNWTARQVTEEITQDGIPFQGEPLAPEPVTQVDEYGLEAVA